MYKIIKKDRKIIKYEHDVTKFHADAQCVGYFIIIN